MESINKRYELILGFVTLIISFSAFKDELSRIIINLGFYSFSLSQYLLVIVYSFGICIYLYIIERIARQSRRLGSLRLIDYIEKFAFFTFVLIVMSPLIITFIYLIFYGVSSFGTIQESSVTIIINTIAFITSLLSIGFSAISTNKVFRFINNSKIDEIEKEEIKELESAVKLFESGFYSHAILEAFKVLEIHIIKLLTKKEIYASKSQFSFIDLQKYALKYELISEAENKKINEMRKMRNEAAHKNATHSKEQAEIVIDLIKNMINRSK